MKEELRMSDITLTINGESVSANASESVLDVCRRKGIDIPTLCNNSEMNAYGSCRLCMVEIEQNGQCKMITSCNTAAVDGLVVNTHTEQVNKQRKMIMEFILARSSNSPEIQAIADRLGVSETRFKKRDDKCMLCGLCIRACAEVVGVSAISFAGRGADRHVSSPFDEEATACIGCGSCAYVCPTNCIEVKEDNNTREFPKWNVSFEMAHCKKCGQKIAPKKQLEYFNEKVELPDDWFDVCNNCR